MFTLGEKIRVLNTDTDITLLDASGTAVTANGDVASDSVAIDINGFGKFNVSEISNIRMRRAQAASTEVGEYAITAPTGIAAGDVVEVRVFMKTSRYQSELKNNFIGAARPLKFSTAPLSATTTTAIGDAIAAAWTSYKNLFLMADLPISTITNSSGTLTVSVAAGYESVNIEKIEIVRVNQGLAIQTPISTAQTITTPGSEGFGLGKFLEESIRMGTWDNTRPYGIDNADTRVDLRGAYTELYFEISITDDRNLSTLVADHGPLARRISFVVWINENTIASDSAVHLLAAQVVDLASSLSNVQVTVDATPDEELEGLILANGTSVALASAFIA